ncbi:MAG: hypothetical protein KFH87_02985 [Bacteroidetes bacterium]|nr:hypothetical protein [Bacteroidota bacterium]
MQNKQLQHIICVPACLQYRPNREEPFLADKNILFSYGKYYNFFMYLKGFFYYIGAMRRIGDIQIGFVAHRHNPWNILHQENSDVPPDNGGDFPAHSAVCEAAEGISAGVRVKARFLRQY